MDNSTSELVAGGHVDVSFSLRSQRGSVSRHPLSLWDEDGDSLQLVVAALDPSSHYAVCYPLCCTGLDCEVFEYTSQPELVSSSSVASQSGGNGGNYLGRVRMRLPLFGGMFLINYVRKINVSPSGRAVSYVHYALGRSGEVNTAAPLYLGPPDLPLAGRRPGLGQYPQQLVASRRGAKDIIHSDRLEIVLEDNRNISAMNISMACKDSSHPSRGPHPDPTLARLMWWVEPISSSLSIRLVFELDVVILSVESNNPHRRHSVETVYAVIDIPGYGIEEAEEDVERLVVSHSWAMTIDGTRLTCRLPYKPSRRSRDRAVEAVDDVRGSLGRLRIHCRHCQTPLLAASAAIHALQPLPTGLLDSVSE